MSSMDSLKLEWNSIIFYHVIEKKLIPWIFDSLILLLTSREERQAGRKTELKCLARATVLLAKDGFRGIF